MYDVIIIGAGVVGTNIARELSKYKLNICLLEKQDDVSCGCSKANSGIVHGGYDDKPGTQKAKFCVAGNRMYEQLEKELNFGYRKTGSLVLAFSDEEKKALEELYERGIKNGVEDLEIIDGEKVRQLEPYVSSDVKWALYCKHSGVCSPYEFTIALAENAIENGVELKLLHEVIGIEKEDDIFNVKTNKGDFKGKYVINAAGVYSDKISKMIGVDDFYIIPRKGEYILLNKDQSYLVNRVIFQAPTEKGKGILVTTTYHGNLMIGPDAQQVDDKDDVSTTEEGLKYIIETARKSVKDFDIKKTLTSFAGIRPTNNTKDFIIKETKVKGFINVAGIDSPGLTSSPAIAKEVLQILKNSGLQLESKDNFKVYRKAIIVKKDSSFQGDINSQDPEKHIICRCERVTEAEIIDALNRKIEVKSLDGIKRRTRAGMGTCQGNFCGSRVRALIARELNINEEEVTKRGPGSSDIHNRVKRIDIMKMK
ncbi:NAD(P)/FAD-dependent oxidoreductase [Clostridium cochlearium]|jgi:glycerol-3-phosphate dehydrogenase|uniref:Glycerol-3-phosphate dehydrogenase n=1 Tax=Clostridium cochlearium TaxID=1494 RepID=A0ABY0QLL4_CLOCO|nr:NAD(P)/FAD-dependent oxidoreductase [Clostridium cochlearium]MCR1971778.1 FAD-dependent oxidoreductase [Clostridium cochlearium]MDU1443726.1 NAD(P)/FAD-dependent oxidoreductase [Clostridium cochlearium]NMA57580.1 NAD(P)/FAD-dependent oxidoreductase [Clostridium cochlearium]NME96110.1 NAD(P)/FAD-dependent oxidoreductase [Clostridium cochlearium]SDL16978.1 glycerol-3-phosphate dehydrogenase [Clostridium cochlearium]